MRITLAAALSAALATSAVAADLTVVVKDAAGRPLPDAVVMVRPAAAAKPQSPIRFTWPMVMSQRNIAFEPYLLIVPVGSQVSFANKDTVRHHIYSFSAAKKFQIKLFGRDETPKLVFDKAGPVALGCNIHDQMIGYIYVTDTPHTAKTVASGEALIRDLPAGPAELQVWRPDLRTGKPYAQSVQVAGNGRVGVTLDLRLAPAGAMRH